jgi:hypothetical protein
MGRSGSVNRNYGDIFLKTRDRRRNGKTEILPGAKIAGMAAVQDVYP